MLKQLKPNTITVKDALTTISYSMEHVVRQLNILSLKERIDIGAHIHSLAKLAEAVDKNIKEDVKARLHNKGGVLNGEEFKAVLAYHDEKRLDTAALKAKKPTIYNQFLKGSEVGVIKYEPR
jgi:predicted phage-related endonuclease